jgi:hypothetical protein
MGQTAVIDANHVGHNYHALITITPAREKSCLKVIDFTVRSNVQGLLVLLVKSNGAYYFSQFTSDQKNIHQ